MVGISLFDYMKDPESLIIPIALIVLFWWWAAHISTRCSSIYYKLEKHEKALKDLTKKLDRIDKNTDITDRWEDLFGELCPTKRNTDIIRKYMEEENPDLNTDKERLETIKSINELRKHLHKKLEKLEEK